MTVAKIATLKVYTGLSTDTKPTGVEVGSKFYEYDTKTTYMTYDGTNWTSLPSVQAILNEVDTFIIADRDEFDVADADADTDRWTPGYITGTEGGAADINTTTTDKLYCIVDPDATPTEARYGVAHIPALFADFFTVIVDLDCTWGATDSATAKALGLIISKGTAYDATNLVKIERQKGTAINRFQANATFNNVAQTAANANTTDDVVALKIERWDNIWRCYYSTVQYPNYLWTLLAQYEDASVFMTDQVTLFLQAYSKGTNTTEIAHADFDNFKYYVGAGGGGQYIAGDYSSAWVSPDIDGNVFERQEALQKAVNVTDAATLTGFEEDGTGANLFNTLIAVQSVTTGAGTTTTLADTARTEGADYWNNHTLITLGGATVGQITTIVDDDGAGVLTLRPAFTAAPGASIAYAILKQHAMPVPTADTTDNYEPRDVIGNKTDAVDWTRGATASSIIALVKGALGSLVIAEGDGFTTDSATIPADTDRTEVTNFFNGCWLMPVTGACAFQPRLITLFTATTDVFTLDPEQPFTGLPGDSAYVILAPNSQLVPAANGTNNRTPAHVIGNKADTSVTGAVTETDTLVAYLKQIVTNTYRLDETACADITDPVDMTTEVADNTILANLLTDDGDTSVYDRRDDSLEAISNKQGATAELTAPIDPTWDDVNKWWEGGTLALLQKIIMYLGAGDGANNVEITEDTSLPYLVRYLYNIADGASVTLDKVVATSILCKLATKGALGGSGATFDNTTDSLEALSDKVGAFTGDGGTDQGDSVKANLDLIQTDIGDPSAASDTLYAQVKHINKTAINVTIPPVANTLADTLHKDANYTYDNTTDSLEAVRDRLDNCVGTEYDGSPDLYDTIVTGHDSSAITANEDGSVQERLESLKLSVTDKEFFLSEEDAFDVADADANNQRWDVGYINGTEGGTADINTTTAGKLRISVDPDVTPTAASYGVHLAQPVTSKYFRAVVDLDVASFGTPAASWATMGVRISPTTYDTNNVVYLQRQSSADGVGNRLCAGAIFASANQGEVYFTSADTALSFMVERLDNVWRLYYSLTQSPNFVWVLLTQYEDSGEAMLPQQSIYLDTYSPGNADTQTAVADFDNVGVYIGAEGIAQQIAGDYVSSQIVNNFDGSMMEVVKSGLEQTTGGAYDPDTDSNEALSEELAKVPKSDAAVTWNNTALASINAEVDTALNTIVPASPTAGSVNDILSVAAGANTFNKATDSLEALRDRIDTLNLADQVDLDAILADTGTDGVVVNSYTTAASRIVGKTQVIEVSVTSAANAGDVTLATVTTQPCLIKSIVVHADTAAQADLTNVGVYGGASKVVTFIDTVTGVKANIDAADEQVAWTGAARFAAAKTIVITLTGTGATPVDLTVTIEYEACVAGGYLA